MMSCKTQLHLKFCIIIVMFSMLLSSCQYPVEKQKHTQSTSQICDAEHTEPEKDHCQVTEQDLEAINTGYFYFRNTDKEVAVNITVTAENPNTVVADYHKFVENHRAKEKSSQDGTVMFQTAFPLDAPVYYSIWFDMRSPEHSWIDIGYNFLNVILINGDTLEIVCDENGYDENGNPSFQLLLRIEHTCGGFTLYSGDITYYT